MKFHDEFKGQLEIGETRQKEVDRNYHLGGRSFYFFDFDDNIAFLTTAIVVFHKKTGEEYFIGSGEWAEVHPFIGISGRYKDYEIRFDDQHGSFRYFRDHSSEELERFGSMDQIFVRDVHAALALPDLQWKGPSWDCFYHAVFNQRPVSIITARGHHPETLKEGIRKFILKGYLPHEPNYLSIFPVSHKSARMDLGDAEMSMGTAQLKRHAIRACVEAAIAKYGYSSHHRFGMSDDDPKNLQSISEELKKLKSTYPEMSFFLIETHQGSFIKHEIKLTSTVSERAEKVSQLDLFTSLQS